MADVCVIMPVRSDGAFPKKKRILEAIAREATLTWHIPDYSEPESFNLERALDQLGKALIVLVDLSLERPSCYYELGLAQALRKRTFLIAPANTRIHLASGRSDVLY